MKKLFWDSDKTTLENIMTICYRVFSYLVPSGLALWNLLIEQMISSSNSTSVKLGFAGICALIVIVVTAVYFLGRHFRKKITEIDGENTELTDKILLATDEDTKAKLLKQKQDLTTKRKSIVKWQEIYHNACFLVPFLLLLVLVTMLEKDMISIRGTLTMICISMASGFGFNCIAQSLVAKNK